VTARNPTWTRDELILALDLYFQVNPAHTSDENPEVIALSKILNALPIHADRPDAAHFRNPSAVYMKMCNFLQLDPGYKGKGLEAGSKLDEVVWNEFASDRKRLHRVADAIRAGMASLSGPVASPADFEGDDEAPEGRVLSRLHRIRERKSALVRRKKELALLKTGVLRCEACDLVFRDRYGDLGKGFIECHHNVPISELKAGETTRLRDLSLVCSNCHRMLHRGGELLSVGALRQLVQEHPALTASH